MSRSGNEAERWRSMVEHAPVMLLSTGASARGEAFNAAWLAFGGRALDDELGDGWHARVHPDDRAPFLALYASRSERGEAFEAELRLLHRDGTHRRVVLRFAGGGGDARAGYVGTCVELPERHDELTGNPELFDMALDHLCVAGFDGYWKRLNRSWSRTLGWSLEELLSRPNIEFVHPDDRAATLAARRALTEGRPVLELTNRYLCKDGTFRWFQWKSVSHVEHGVVYAVARDVTAEREAARALAELTDGLTTILNSIEEGVIATDASGAVTRMNPVAERLTGFRSSEAVGRPLDAVFVIEGAAPSEQRLVARKGALPVAFSRSPMRDADGSVTGSVVVFRDRTAENEAERTRERLQRQQMIADRMTSVATLAAGVAHGINNPLAYVVTNLETFLEELPRIDPAMLPARVAEWMEMAADARHGAERIGDIVRALKTFSYADEERRTHLDPARVVELAIQLVADEIGRRARVVNDHGAIPLVVGDEARLAQVFVNLLVNAAQAIPEGGGDHEIRVVTATDDAGHAVVEVHDTGPGVPTDLVPRIFDAFFTTKPIGAGTGLGLSVCHNIVRSMGGEITVENGAERGAIFRVVLPPAKAAR